jgi:hypothetical protein
MLILAALHPTTTFATLGVNTGFGGVLEPKTRELTRALGHDRVPWYSKTDDTLRDVDILGAFALMAEMRYLRFTYQKEVSLADVEQGSVYTFMMNLPEWGNSRVSDCTAHNGPVPTPFVWWLGNPLPGRMVVETGFVPRSDNPLVSSADGRVDPTATLNTFSSDQRLVPAAIRRKIKTQPGFNKDMRLWRGLQPVTIDANYDRFSPHGLYHDLVSYEDSNRAIRFYHDATRALAVTDNPSFVKIDTVHFNNIHKYTSFSVPDAITPASGAGDGRSVVPSKVSSGKSSSGSETVVTQGTTISNITEPSGLSEGGGEGSSSKN